MKGLHEIKIGVKVIIFFILSGSATISFSQTQKDCNERIKQGIELFSNKEYQQSLKLLTEEVEEAKANNWKHETFLATNNIGSNYYGLGEFNEAIKYFLEAFQLAEENLDKTSQMTCINNIAVIYYQDRDFPNAQYYFKKAYSLAEELKIEDKQGLYSLNLAMVNNNLKNLEEAYFYIEKAGKLLSMDKVCMVRVELAKAEWHLFKGELKAAKDILLGISTEFEENKLREDKMYQQFLLSDIYTQEKDYKLALKHALAAREVISGMGNLINCFNVLSDIYVKQENYTLAIAYKDSAIIYKDSLFAAKIDESFQRNKIKFQVLDYQQELRESKLEASKNRILFYSILSIAGLLALFGVFLFRNYKEKGRQQKKLAELELSKKESEKLLLENKLNEKEALEQLNRERYKNEMDGKNRELLVKAFVQSSQNESIDKLLGIMENHSNADKTGDLRQIKAQLKNLTKDKNHWQKFFLHFEETNPGFIKRLCEKHPDLNENELRFVTYIYINLSNKEVASLLNISYSSVRKRKERFSKKLGLSSTSDLYNYLLSI